MDDVLAWWHGLPPESQRGILVVSGGLLVMRSLGTGKTLLVGGVAWFLSQNIPAKASFLPWFERWFKDEYFPKLAEKLKFELDQRSKKRKSLLDSLSDKVNSWFVGSTKGLQASFVYELLDKRVMFTDLWVCRLASTNIGSRSKPCHVCFVGVHNQWMLAPWHSVDFDNLSILEGVEPGRASQARTG
mmetsp:Transcript_7919/g.21665  ORF Transcript_7919/g.21665 Transcript_7919/m.21665 type:complete len:187 (+) Transcript_7919:99-659(+)